MSACRFCNTSTRFELFVPEVSAKLQLLSNSSLESITATVQVRLPVICIVLPLKDSRICMCSTSMM